MQASGVLGGVEGTSMNDQEQCHKERDTRTQHWVIASLGVWWREEATEGEGSKQAPRVMLPEQGHPAPDDVFKIQAPYQGGGAVNCYHPQHLLSASCPCLVLGSQETDKQPGGL